MGIGPSAARLWAVIDHLVLATPELAPTVAAIHGRWGVHLEEGGQHVGRGTRNQLTGLGRGSYLEVIGPDPQQQDPTGPRPFGVDSLTRARLVAWCARPKKPINDVLGPLTELGLSLGPVAAMERERPDGVHLHWRLTFPLLEPPHSGTVPFLIDWQDSPHPADDLPTDVTLERLRLRHPNPKLLRTALRVIGEDDRIEIIEGPAGLGAMLLTPNGRFVL